jgi:hypothetical protein
MKTDKKISTAKTNRQEYMHQLMFTHTHREGREVYSTRPSVEGLVSESMTLLRPVRCFDFLLVFPPSNFCNSI